MKVGAIAENLAERLVLLAGWVPTPVLDSFHTVLMARSVMVATRLGVFDAVARQPRTADELAADLGVDAAALVKLANVLIALGYLVYDGGRYGASPLSRRWLSADSPHSVRDNMLLRFLEWQAIEKMEDFVRTGQALDVHDLLEADQWDIYQRGMRALARLSAGEVAARVAVPARAGAMLDIGGGHGAYSAAFCRRHPSLRATILDLPQGVQSAAPLLAEASVGLDGRLQHLAGDARREDLGENRWDLIFVSHLVHHFDLADNEDLVRRAARALRPGGVLAILDVLRVDAAGRVAQTGALLDLYFAITSQSGTWSKAEVDAWSRAAGLRPTRALKLRTAPGISVVLARKPGDRG